MTIRTKTIIIMYAALGLSACVGESDREEDLVATRAQAIEGDITPAEEVVEGESADESSNSETTSLLSEGAITVDLRRAPGPDGRQATADDILFPSTWTGPMFFNYPSPTGDEWASLGVKFAPIDGAVALTNASGCFGSQNSLPSANWDGSMRITFVDPETGQRALADNVTIELVNPPVTVRAYDASGSLMETRRLTRHRDNISINRAGIDRIDISGDFWCVHDAITYTVRPANSAPVAECSDARVDADEQCQACASVDAGSHDPDGDTISVVESPGCDYQLGENAVTLTATDEHGASSTCTATVTVIDATPPTVDLREQHNFYPSDYEMHEFKLSDCAEFRADNCDEHLDIDRAGEIVSIYSDEADKHNEYDCENDIEIIDNSTFRVRNERDSYGNGRVYGVDFVVVDSAGNSSEVYTCHIGVKVFLDDGCHDAPVDDGPVHVVYR
ncbi:MAG: hypothetical protein MJE77_12520 [Proteobacteria bacterium]|nr:hypothetical protein [Pseudomonadota bacterium]